MKTLISTIVLVSSASLSLSAAAWNGGSMATTKKCNGIANCNVVVANNKTVATNVVGNNNKVSNKHNNNKNSYNKTNSYNKKGNNSFNKTTKNSHNKNNKHNNNKNSYNKTYNNNSVKNRNNVAKQGQMQGQMQGIAGSGNSTVGDVNVTINGTLGEDRAIAQPDVIDVDARNLSTEGDVVVQGDSVVYQAQRRAPVNTAYAAPIIATEDTCMGSTSVGGQGITIGFSFAKTWSDKNCVIRKDSRAMYNQQRPIIALSVMCEKESIRNAVERAGTREEKLACGLPVPAAVTVKATGVRG